MSPRPAGRPGRSGGSPPLGGSEMWLVVMFMTTGQRGRTRRAAPFRAFRRGHVAAPALRLVLNNVPDRGVRLPDVARFAFCRTRQGNFLLRDGFAAFLGQGLA